MLFNTEKERLEHPQAGLIPLNIWKDVYSKHEFSDKHVGLMLISEDLLESELTNNLKALDSLARGKLNSETYNKIKLTFWYALAYREPRLKDETLLHYLEKLTPNPRSRFDVLMTYGSQTLMRRLIQSIPKTYTAVDYAQKTLHLALEGRHRLLISDILSFILKESVLTEATRERYIPALESVFMRAIYDGSLEVVKCFLPYRVLITENAIKKFMSCYEHPGEDRDTIFDILIEGKDSVELFRHAVENGTLESVRRIFNQASNKVALFGGNDFYKLLRLVFNKNRIYCINNNVEEIFYFIVEQAREIVPCGLSYALIAEDFALFKEFIHKSEYRDINENILALFLEIVPKECHLPMLMVDNCALFFVLFKHQKLECIKRLFEFLPDEIQSILRAEGYHVFCQTNNLAQIHFILDTAKSENILQEALASNKYRSAFFKTIDNGSDEIYHRFFKEASAENQLKMISMNDYEMFSVFSAKGRFDLMKDLTQKFPEHKENMLKSKEYISFRQCLPLSFPQGYRVCEERPSIDEKKRIEFLDQMQTLVSDSSVLQMMVIAKGYSVIHNAISAYHFDEFQKLLAWVLPEHYETMLISIFNHVAYCIRDQSLLRQVLGLVSDERRASILKSLQYKPFIDAVNAENFTLIDELMPLETDKSALFGVLIGRLSTSLNQAMVTFLFDHSIALFDHAEKHANNLYGTYVKRYVNKRMKALKKACLLAEANNPNGVFDVSSSDAHFYFYAIRYFIRLNTPESIESIEYLIEIPSIRAILADEITPQQSNELIRLALQLGHQDAIRCLLGVPAIADLARSNNFYQAEARGELDLRALAADRESSMVALTAGELRRLDEVIKYYELQVKAKGGVEAVMKELHQRLIARYEQNPVRLTLNDGTEFIARWNFSNLQSCSEDKKKILEGYFLHKVHTALRWISNPNQLLTNSPYIYRGRTDEGQELRWSTFVDYKPMIAMFYLAAIDPNPDERIAPCDGYTLETRFMHFIEELALIGRAHNWDKKRPKKDEQGRDVLNEQGRPILEEYDDLGLDNPACFSGVKRRLFQSVQGHPLLKMLRMDDVKQLTRSFVREHFESVIQKVQDIQKLKKAWDAVCEYPEEKDLDTLKVLNISEEKQNEFIANLSQHPRYGSAFRADTAFTAYIRIRFEPECHAMMFGGEVDLKQLLENACLCGSKRKAGLGFFDESTSSSSSGHDEKRTKRAP